MRIGEIGRHEGNFAISRGPQPSSLAARERMVRTRQRDTTGELALRSALHRLGLRFRVQVKPIADFHRRADIVHPRFGVAVFVDGCFWHGCPKHATWPKANSEFWRDKILANQQRDRSTTPTLKAAGWKVIRIWEHADPNEAPSVIERMIRRHPLGRI